MPILLIGRKKRKNNINHCMHKRRKNRESEGRTVEKDKETERGGEAGTGERGEERGEE